MRVPARRPTQPSFEEALAPVRGWLIGDGPDPDRATLATAVRVSLRAFAAAHPGRAVEVRVPPFAAVQCIAGQTHTRGTPPHVVETDARCWLELVTGRTGWSGATAAGRVSASGHRAAELGDLLPFTG